MTLILCITELELTAIRERDPPREIHHGADRTARDMQPKKGELVAREEEIFVHRPGGPSALRVCVDLWQGCTRTGQRLARAGGQRAAQPFNRLGGCFNPSTLAGEGLQPFNPPPPSGVKPRPTQLASATAARQLARVRGPNMGQGQGRPEGADGDEQVKAPRPSPPPRHPPPSQSPSSPRVSAR